jgi:monofunctional biosynthetic peptidoglycan transglycosylase
VVRSARIRGAVVATAAALLGLAGGFAVWWWSVPGELAVWRSGPPPQEWAAWRRQEALWRAEGSRRAIANSYLPLDEIPEDAALAVLVSEDISYFAHGAIDLSAVREAVTEWREGRRLRGASTITQQLARTLFLSGERTLTRKLEEARLAHAMERVLGKRRILELYLNVVEFGPGVFGVDAAARRYYGVGAAQLGRQEAAGLAAAIPSPGRDNPATATRRWEYRKAIILARMARADWLRDELRALRRPREGRAPQSRQPAAAVRLANQPGGH